MTRGVRLRAAVLMPSALLVSSIFVFPAQAIARHMCLGHPATIVGTAKDDRLVGTAGRDVIVGLGGADEIDAGGGDDIICGNRNGRDDDRPELLAGGRGNDVISGGLGDDVLYGGPGRDRGFGGPGDDGLGGQSGADVLAGGGGDDALKPGPGHDIARGGRGDDIFYSGPGDDDYRGGRAHDLIDFHSGPAVEVDLSTGTATGDGSDVLAHLESVWGSESDDHIIGNSSGNLLVGSSGNDVLIGLGGDDCLLPGIGENTVDGGDGFDSYTASAIFACESSPFPGQVSPTSGVTVDLSKGTAIHSGVTDTLVSIEGAYGTSQEDTLIGDEGDNRLFGGPSADEIRGNEGDDLLHGGMGTDRLDGGAGTDSCLEGEVLLMCE